MGLMLWWEAETFLYVEHFCILPAARNRGCGGRALAHLAEKGKTVILEIDPPVDEISLRREAFYERCGYRANIHPHVHPPYRAGLKTSAAFPARWALAPTTFRAAAATPRSSWTAA